MDAWIQALEALELAHKNAKLALKAEMELKNDAKKIEKIAAANDAIVAKKVSLPRGVSTCSTCEGTGAIGYFGIHCLACNGTGMAQAD